MQHATFEYAGKRGRQRHKQMCLLNRNDLDREEWVVETRPGEREGHRLFYYHHLPSGWSGVGSPWRVRVPCDLVDYDEKDDERPIYNDDSVILHPSVLFE